MEPEDILALIRVVLKYMTKCKAIDKRERER